MDLIPFKRIEETALKEVAEATQKRKDIHQAAGAPRYCAQVRGLIQRGERKCKARVATRSRLSYF